MTLVNSFPRGEGGGGGRGDCLSSQRAKEEGKEVAAAAEEEEEAFSLTLRTSVPRTGSEEGWTQPGIQSREDEEKDLFTATPSFLSLCLQPSRKRQRRRNPFENWTFFALPPLSCFDCGWVASMAVQCNNKNKKSIFPGHSSHHFLLLPSSSSSFIFSRKLAHKEPSLLLLPIGASFIPRAFYCRRPLRFYCRKKRKKKGEKMREMAVVRSVRF